MFLRSNCNYYLYIFLFSVGSTYVDFITFSIFNYKKDKFLLQNVKVRVLYFVKTLTSNTYKFLI